MNTSVPRQVYIVLSAKSLSYSRTCLRSLFRNVLEPISMTLITDSPADKLELIATMEEMAPDPRHSWKVVDEPDADARAEVLYAKYPLIRWFRKGHPCWRKITDPSLFAETGQEMVVLDPDVYFPNPFNFEETPTTGLLLMWQRRNCLYPPETVRLAFDNGIRMADHGDIGVYQATFPFDFDWLEHLLEKLGGESLPTWSMHVESIIWAAMAMEFGGGYLDPKIWLCCRYKFSMGLKLRLLKADPVELLKDMPLSEVKCFHAGGPAKHWLVAAEKAGLLVASSPKTDPTAPLPYRNYPRAKFDRKQLAIKVATSMGVMSLIRGSA
jgi:hypothetical protein